MAKAHVNAESPAAAGHRDAVLFGLHLVLEMLYPAPECRTGGRAFRLDATDTEHISDLLLKARAVVRRAVVVPLAAEAGAASAARADEALQRLLRPHADDRESMLPEEHRSADGEGGAS
ncbi:hypothetical protein [Variovorax sp. GB1P17]|uniref:hypothetical protein n=1 Tax=Variovorax sp. GB1P17 TaxID=3443740 RepID=UPI003F45BF82